MSELKRNAGLPGVMLGYIVGHYTVVFPDWLASVLLVVSCLFVMFLGYVGPIRFWPFRKFE